MLKMKSIESYISADVLEAKLVEIGFKCVSMAIVVSDSKFWNKKLYRSGEETVTVANDIGEATHLRDPVITLCANKNTIDRFQKSI